MTKLTDLATGETAGSVGNGHETRPLREMGDFLVVTLQREYAYLEYSGMDGREGGQARESGQSIIKN